MLQSAVAILVVILVAISAESAPMVGLDAFLAQQYRADPSAAKDSFSSLPSHLRSSVRPDLPSLMASLVVAPSLHVRLVSASPSSSSAASLLRSYVSAAGTFHVISPPSHSLSASHSLHLDVSPAAPSLAPRLSRAIADEIASSAASLRSPLAAVPYSLVDDIIAQDFQKESPLHGVYLYFLDLGPHSKPYAYTHGAAADSPAFTRCLGTVWTGNHRYVWIDLGAGPVDYGPAISGDGVLPRGDFHPLATLHGRPKSDKTFVADLASLVASAYQALLVPSLRIPVPFEEKLVVQFIHVYGVENGDPSGLDWKLIEKALTEEKLVLGEQSLAFMNYRVSYADCPICAYAVSRATNSYTSRFLFDNYTMIVNEYLDSKRLHRILSDSGDEMRRVASVPPEEQESGRVVPVYVFDLDVHSQLLLDRQHQSVAFKDMVVAVRTRNTQTVSDYTCNGRHVFSQTRALERPLVGSILQTMWGVAPTHLAWSARHNASLVDYTWSVGNTPFGPFSDSLSLSFAERDAARRNTVLTAINLTVANAAEAVDTRLLLKDGAVEFAQRWNLLKYKLEKAVSALSRLDFDMAMHYVRSCDHDMYAMHSLVYAASHHLEASLSCFKDPPLPWLSVSVTAAAFVMLFYVYAKRDKFFRNKRKQF